jgi:hypothetical protein
VPASDALAYLHCVFADPVAAFDGFADDEIGVGLWSMLDSGGAGTVLVLNDPSLPVADRVDCCASIITLYRELFAARCTERLGHLSEQDGRLDMACYMFWDVAAFGGRPGDPDGEPIEAAVLTVLRAALDLEHAACQESAIHGLGHRVDRHPGRVPALLDEWLRQGSTRDVRLRAYASSARDGCIL